MRVSPIDGHRLWAEHYDRQPNPLLALEARCLARRLPPLRDRRIIDVGAGTGRWMEHAGRQGAQVFGIDLCAEMLREAAQKQGLAGRLALADCIRLPFRDAAADLALCSFVLAYVRPLSEALRELSRVAQHVVTADLHPEAASRGWKRSFQADGRNYELDHNAYTARQILRAGMDAGLIPEWRMDARFGPPEREIFMRAGKESRFDELAAVPAILIVAWSRP